MALWQISFLFLPKALVAGIDEVPSDIFERYANNLSDVFPSFVLPPDYADCIERLLPPKIGWSDNMELWGDEISDDVTIWREGGKVTSIGVRVDVRKLDDVLLSGLLALADAWDCVLVERRYQKVCRMTLQDFRTLICGHPHSRAIKDPKAWLPVLAEEIRKNENAPNKSQKPTTVGIVFTAIRRWLGFPH